MPESPTPARPALDAMAEEIERLEKQATPGPLTRSALVMLYAVQDYGDNEVVAGFGEWEDNGDLRMRFQGDKADANLALYVYLRNNAPALVAALRSLADMREIEKRARELLTAVKFAGESEFGPPEDRFPGYEARVPSEFVTNLEAALARSAP